mmetsp:Transcript_137402/g.194429  ORF Transcript_137402/g.194429 Transcript_137402/m.194429 type:complete len:100 (+) Transcript_137402:264-563(+)
MRYVATALYAIEQQRPAATLTMGECVQRKDRFAVATSFVLQTPNVAQTSKLESSTAPLLVASVVEPQAASKANHAAPITAALAIPPAATQIESSDHPCA